MWHCTVVTGSLSRLWKQHIFTGNFILLSIGCLNKNSINLQPPIFFPHPGEAVAGFLEELAVCMSDLQMSQLLAWNGEIAFLSSHVPLFMWRGDTRSMSPWKRGIPNLDYAKVWDFFLKAYTALEFDSKHSVDFKDHWTGTTKEELYKVFKWKYPVVLWASHDV